MGEAMCLRRSARSRGAGAGRKRHEGRGNAALWEEWKAESRLPTLPTALGNRFPIPTFPPPRRRFPYTEIQQVALRATVTYVAGLKCYPCPRPVISARKYRRVFLSRARQQAVFGLFQHPLERRLAAMIGCPTRANRTT